MWYSRWMAVPFSQLVRVGSHILKQKLKRRKRFPLVLMLDPLYRCNLTCAGCGKIQYPDDILEKFLSPEECFRAAQECGAPVVSIAGGEPLLHPNINDIVSGLLCRRKVVYLCTNGILLEQKLSQFVPSSDFNFNVHVDGLKERHDRLVGRKGVFDRVVAGICASKKRGFRVTTNSTIYAGDAPKDVADLLDFLMSLGVDGLIISPGFSYEKASAQDHFLCREETIQVFQSLFEIGKMRKSKWVFNHSPLFLDFLQGKVDYECTPWANPNFSVFGWQRPCYLFSDGYAQTFEELLTDTAWPMYGRASQNPKCENCMVHCGYEGSAVMHSTQNLPEALRSLRFALAG